MNDIAWMDRYWKEVLEVSTWKHDIKGSVSLQYFYDKEALPAFLAKKKNVKLSAIKTISAYLNSKKFDFIYFL